MCLLCHCVLFCFYHCVCRDVCTYLFSMNICHSVYISLLVFVPFCLCMLLYMSICVTVRVCNSIGSRLCLYVCVYISCVFNVFIRVFLICHFVLCLTLYLYVYVHLHNKDNDTRVTHLHYTYTCTTHNATHRHIKAQKRPTFPLSQLHDLL